jgi:hypothetical protein
MMPSWLRESQSDLGFTGSLPFETASVIFSYRFSKASRTWASISSSFVSVMALGGSAIFVYRFAIREKSFLLVSNQTVYGDYEHRKQALRGGSAATPEVLYTLKN